MLVSLFFLLALASHGFSYNEYQNARHDQLWRNQDFVVNDADYEDHPEKSSYGLETLEVDGSNDPEYSNPYDYNSNSKVQEGAQNRMAKVTENPIVYENEDDDTTEDNYDEFDDNSYDDDGKVKGEASIDNYSGDHYGYSHESDDENLNENDSKTSKLTTNDQKTDLLRRNLKPTLSLLVNNVKEMIKKIHDELKHVTHATAKPKPSVTEKPKPSVTEKPKPSVTEKPKPSVTEKPKPSVPAKPKPIVPAKPKPIVPAKPKPSVTEKPKPSVPAKPKPIVPAKPKSGVTVKPNGKGKHDYDSDDEYYSGYDIVTHETGMEDYIDDNYDYPENNNQGKKKNGAASNVPGRKPNGTEKPKGKDKGGPQGKPKPPDAEKPKGKVVMRRRVGGIERGTGEGKMVGNDQGNNYYNGYPDYPLTYQNGRSLGRKKHRGKKNKFGDYYYDYSNENYYYNDDYSGDYPLKKVKPFAPGRKIKKKFHEENITKKPSHILPLPHLAIFGKLSGFVEQIFGTEEK